MSKVKKVLSGIIILVSLFSVATTANAQNKVDINTASLEELDTLDGIGATLGKRIIENRPYETIDDLSKVKGIGPKTIEKIKVQGLAFVPEKEKKQKLVTVNYMVIESEMNTNTFFETAMTRNWLAYTDKVNSLDVYYNANLHFISESGEKVTTVPMPTLTYDNNSRYSKQVTQNDFSKVSFMVDESDAKFDFFLSEVTKKDIYDNKVESYTPGGLFLDGAVVYYDYFDNEWAGSTYSGTGLDRMIYHASPWSENSDMTGSGDITYYRSGFVWKQEKSITINNIFYHTITSFPLDFTSKDEVWVLLQFRC